MYNVSVQGQAGIGGRVNCYVDGATGRKEAGLREVMGWTDNGNAKYEEVAKIWDGDKEIGRTYINNVLVLDGKLKIGVNLFLLIKIAICSLIISGWKKSGAE